VIEAATPVNHGTGVHVMAPVVESTAYVPWFGTMTTGRPRPDTGSMSSTEDGVRVPPVPGWSFASVARVTGWFWSVVVVSGPATGGDPTTTETLEEVTVPLLSATWYGRREGHGPVGLDHVRAHSRHGDRRRPEP
jgi:hypothetical protein